MGAISQLMAGHGALSSFGTNSDNDGPDGGGEAPASMAAPKMSAPNETSVVGSSQGSTPPPPEAPATPTAAQQQVIDGFGTAMPAPDAKAPPNMTAANIGKLGDGLLDNMDDTDLQGKGGMKTLLAQRCGGKDADAIKTDPDVAWRAYQTTMAIKNRDAGGGKAQSSDARFDGKIDGFFKDHSQGGKLNANAGTDAGAMQDLLLHGEVPPPAQDIGKPPAPGTTQAQQLAMDGNTTDLPAVGEKAPPGLSPSDIAGLNGGLLGGLGGQSVTMDGQKMSLRAGFVLRYGDDSEKAALKDAKTPEEKDAVARKALQNNPDTAWRAYRALTAVKNETANDGTPKPTGLRHNGKIGGYTKAGDDGLAPHGSEAGSLQDLLQSGRVPSALESHPSDWTDKFGQGQSESQVAGKEFKRALPFVLAALAVIAAPFTGGASLAGEGAVVGAEVGVEVGTEVGAEVGGEIGGEVGAGVGGAAGDAASFGTSAVRGMVGQLAKTGMNVSEDEVKQALIAVTKEAGKQGVKLGKDQLEDRVKQYIDAQKNGTQQPDPSTIAWDQPRAIAAAAA